MIMIHCAFDFCVVRYHPKDVRFQYRPKSNFVILSQLFQKCKHFFTLYGTIALQVRSHKLLFRLFWRCNNMIFALIDDTKQDRDYLRSLLLEYSAHHSIDMILHDFSSGEEFLKAYRPFQYAAVFLDIYMDGMTGLETADALRKTDRNLPLIFITSSPEHMSEALRLHAYEYLTKPFDKSRLFQLMDDLMHRQTKTEDCLSFLSNRENQILPYSQIVFIRSANHTTEIQAKNGKLYTTRMNFSDIADQLCTDPRFLPIIRGVMVNMDDIIRFEAHSCYLEHNIQLPVNVRNFKQIEQFWKNYVFQKIRSEHIQ